MTLKEALHQLIEQLDDDSLHSESACEYMHLHSKGKDVIRVSELPRIEFVAAP